MDREIELFYDGDCPLCSREVAVLRRLDRAQRVLFTDIAAPGFDADSVGLTQAQLMARIHARTREGEVLEGVEVFRRIYAALGFERTAALSRLPGVRAVLDAGYRVFARNRLWLTGRPSCDTGACSVPRTP